MIVASCESKQQQYRQTLGETSAKKWDQVLNRSRPTAAVRKSLGCEAYFAGLNFDPNLQYSYIMLYDVKWFEY